MPLPPRVHLLPEFISPPEFITSIQRQTTYPTHRFKRLFSHGVVRRLSQYTDHAKLKFTPYARHAGPSAPELHWTRRSILRNDHTNISIADAKASMDEETIKQAVSTMQATREKSHLHLLMTAWEIEEAEHHQMLLSLLQRKNAREYIEASNEAHMFERFMTHCHTNQLEDDFDFGVGTYDEELLEFSISEEQLNQLEAFAINHNLHDSTRQSARISILRTPSSTVLNRRMMTKAVVMTYWKLVPIDWGIKALSDHASQETIEGKAEIKANTEIPRVHREEPMWQYRQRSDWTGHRASGSAIQTGYTASSAHPPQPRPHSAQLMAGPSVAPYVRSLQQGLPHMYNMMCPPQMNPLSQDTMGGALTMSHPQFMERRPPQMDLPSRDFMIPPSSHQSMAGPSTIPRTSFLPQMARQIPPSNQQSMAGTSAIPPAQFEQQMPSQSTTPFQYQSCLQAPVLNMEGIHQAADNYRPVCAASRAAPYEAYRLIMAYAKSRPGELVRGEEFSTGVIRVVPGSSRAVHKPVHLRLPPVEPQAQGVEMHSSPSTMNSVNAWVAGSQKTEVKKLKTIPNSIQSIFKDVGRSAVDFALPISERNKELVHQQVYIDSLCIGFAYLDDPDTRLSCWIDPNKHDHDNIIAFSGTILLWALQEHAKGTTGKSEFVVEDNRAAFDSIVQRLNDLSPSERAAVDKLVDDILAEMQ
ncbi:hypothetical protein BDR07DRAFT_1456201 [Suillus spraguei]|nr:hypothetical protein BDR07DRAFT_1456201 [Suillus spraguei]